MGSPRVFTILAAGLIPPRLLPVEFIEGEDRAKRLCKSLAVEFPHLIFSHEAWAAERLEEPPASISMASGAFKGAYGDEARAVAEAARSMVMFMGGRGPALNAGKSPSDKGSKSSPASRVSSKVEKKIKDAMRQLGSGATTKDIAKTAGVWLSGLRLEESLALSWDADSGFSIDLGGRHPRFRIARDAQKSGKDQILPATPDFAEWLLQTPPDERHGQVFRLLGLQSGQPITPKRVSRLVTKIGKKAGVVVNREMKWIRERTIEEKTGKPTGPPRLVEREVVKYASAHDLRRSFGTRWAKRVMPATLKLLMRHSSVDTTMRYYVEMDADDVAADLWTQHAVESEPTGGGLGTILGTSGQKPGKTPAMASRRDRRNSL